MIKLSVIICVHEARQSKLRRCTEAMRKQTLPSSQWELLLVERADNQKPAAYDLGWHAGSRIFRENAADPTLLLRRAISERKSDLLIVLDQNVEPASDYLSEVVQISRQWPRLGVWGSGAIDLEFEANPSASLRELASQVARRNIDTLQYSNVLTCVEATPPGPGLCVRTDVAAAYCERPIPSLKAHKTGDDIFALDLAAAELGYLACRMGLGMGIFPQLKLTRVISSSSGERQFLDHRERESILRALLNREWKGIRPADPLTPAALVSAARSVLLESGVRRRLQIAEFKAAIKARKMLQAPDLESAQ